MPERHAPAELAGRPLLLLPLPGALLGLGAGTWWEHVFSSSDCTTSSSIPFTFCVACPQVRRYTCATHHLPAPPCSPPLTPAALRALVRALQVQGLAEGPGGEAPGGACGVAVLNCKLSISGSCPTEGSDVQAVGQARSWHADCCLFRLPRSHHPSALSCSAPAAPSCHLQASLPAASATSWLSMCFTLLPSVAQGSLGETALKRLQVVLQVRPARCSAVNA